MPTDSLPDKPNLERLANHARTLRDLVRSGTDGAIALVREHHPRFGDLTAGAPEATRFKLTDAQLTVARHYDFASWPKLRSHVEAVNRLTRSPHEVADVSEELDSDTARADELLRLGCLNYSNDQASRWADAGKLLDAHLHLAGFSIHTAAAVGDIGATTAFLEHDPGVASIEGGPFRWAPLVYLTYSRIPPRPGTDAVAVARLLLEAGADPNAGYLWDGLPSPFTALTGVFGRGEQGAPPHRDETALARLLIAAGADANDSQTIYNRGLGDIARDDTEFLELLLDHGLGRGDGGPWHRLLGHTHQTPTEIAAEALHHAAEAGLVNRTRLLLSRGIDPNRRGTHPAFHDRSPYQSAVLHGNTAIAGLLADAGADTSGIDPLSAFVGACLAGHRVKVTSMLNADPTLIQRSREQHGDLVARAVTLQRIGVIAYLVELGYDINARNRTTALHEAALRGDLPMVQHLIAHGADPTIADTEFNSPPQGWANHAGHQHVVTYLETIT